MRRMFALVTAAAAALSMAATTPTAPGAPHRTAADPPWAKYVVAPSGNQVKPAKVIGTTGSVDNPDGALGSGVATLSRPQPAAKPSWPEGSTADASSVHPPTDDNGQQRTYEPGNALDGDTGTFWNDDSIGAYPDSLTLTSPAAVDLPGITVLSNSDGVPQDFTVETWDGSAWRPAGSVAGNTGRHVQVPFTAPVSTTQVRITVTKDQPTAPGEFTRINEVWPGLVPDDAPPSITVDFGKNIVGYPQVDFQDASAEHPGVRLAFSETTQYLGDVSDFTRSDNGDTITPGTDQHAVPAGVSTWTDHHGCAEDTKVCADGLHGFRYLRISLDALPDDAPAASPYGWVKLSGISLQFTGYLGTPDTYRGWFDSSDEQLNQYWYNASYTNEMGTDTFRPDDVDPRNADSPTLDGKLVLQDGAKRDRDPYVGDVAVSGLTTYLTHDTAVAAKNVLADLAEHQRADGWIPPASISNYSLQLFDYPMYWVKASWDYVLYTGDLDYAQQYYANLGKVLNDWLPSVTDENGLLQKGLNGTEDYGDYAFLGRTGEVTYYNALYVLALRNAAGIANALGHADDADTWNQRADTVAGAVNAHLWDDSAGAYLDSGTGEVRHGQDGNGYAILAGIASADQQTRSLDYLSAHTTTPYGNAFMDNDTLVPDGSKRVYAFTSYPEISARFRSGNTDSAIEEINRLYGWMATHDPGGTDWEGIGPDGSMYEDGFTSAAHGWSTGVVPALTNDLLGATPTGPGFSTWSVVPHPGKLAWAQGRVPTPHGALDVSWKASANDFSMTVTGPADTTGQVSIPVPGDNATLSVDGNPVEVEVQNGYLTVPSDPGAHTYTATF
ncbi:alpha-L-rhamnosidase C-terminal domain-containing protein [Amycolatopsis ultiminotia]